MREGQLSCSPPRLSQQIHVRLKFHTETLREGEQDRKDVKKGAGSYRSVVFLNKKNSQQCTEIEMAKTTVQKSDGL